MLVRRMAIAFAIVLLGCSSMIAAPIGTVGAGYGVVGASSGSSITYPGSFINSLLDTSAANVPFTGGATSVISGLNITLNNPAALYNVDNVSGNVLLSPTMTVTIDGTAYNFDVINTLAPGDNPIITRPVLNDADNGSGSIGGFLAFTGTNATHDFGPVGQLYSFQFSYNSATGDVASSMNFDPATQTFNVGPNNSTNASLLITRIPGQVRNPPGEVPEPATLGTFAVLGLAGLAARRKMKKAVA